MRQFIDGSEAAYADLAARASGACVVFCDEELPNALPARGRIGFEGNPNDGSVTLLVDRGLTYRGSNRSIGEWLAAGEKHFDSFATLREWLRRELSPEYVPAQTMPGRSASMARPRADELTDLEEARQGVHDSPRSLVDEDALFRSLAATIRGQDQALRKLASVVCRHVARQHPRRPATLFAVGPTGVGKTKTGETLALLLNELRGSASPYSYVRLDMSEYQESHRVSQLLGAPQGYIGYGDGSQLLDTLSANPKTVVLFDEIEKAHPNILRALMNAMDAGRLSKAASSEGTGHVVDCRQAIFLFTSNLDMQVMFSDLPVTEGLANPDAVDDICRRHLRTTGVSSELLGRIGAFLVFHPLSKDVRVEIVTLSIARVAEEYGVRVARVEPSVVANIVSSAGDNGFGARPDERLVDELLGEAFMNASRDFPRTPVTVSGPPFVCRPDFPLVLRE
jgi:hypothetical protein